jgi:uncharacterized Zn finger protein
LTDASTIGALVARFALRRRASTPAFADGVRLARLGAVTVDEISPQEVRGHVDDGQHLDVRVFAADGQLLGECPCRADEHGPCRHQVALAHVVWVKHRRGIV